MDPQYGLASKDDLWRLQTEMRNVHATQAEHADRLMRLEQRQDAKSAWGTQSPFPSVLNGTPQQGNWSSPLRINQLLTHRSVDQGYNPAAEAFKNFDQDQSNSMMGSLHLDTDDEPRRGASRANSVRFDESALHGHFGQGSRSSTDFLPMRTGSAFGSHPMSERSTSHKSDGRQSSTHSARASTIGFEPRPLSAATPAFVPLGPPPGLFILGPVPSIIRCWLDTNFSNESLLYAAVCTGSYNSILDLGLISRLGFENQTSVDREGQRTIKLPVYLPEATIQQSSARSSSPAPSLPTVTTTFLVQDLQCKRDAIQIFIGSDILRAQNADIHFSLDRLTLFDDDRNKLSVPLVRPERAASFQGLQTVYAVDHSLQSSIADLSGQVNEYMKINGKAKEPLAEQSTKESEDLPEETKTEDSTNAMPPPSSKTPSVIGSGRKISVQLADNESTLETRVNTDVQDSESLSNGTTPDTPSKAENGNVWGPSWRRDSTQGTRPEASALGLTSGVGYNRVGRGRGMKVLRPSRANAARSSSAQQPLGFDAAPSRFTDPPRSATDENSNSNIEGRSVSGDAKTLVSGKPKSSNPLGGASAFGWMNSSQQKRPPNASTD